MLTTKKSQKEVFVSRQIYKREMYINRTEYETKFIDAYKSHKCIILRGNSGSGKTWLTNYVIEENDIQYKKINLAEMQRFSSLNEYFKSILDSIPIEYTEQKEVGANIPIASGKLSTKKRYLVKHNYYSEFLSKFKNSGLLIFENFESIINREEIISDLAALITLSDDPEIQKHKVHLLFIGANTEMISLFEKLPNADTIDNRTIEIEVLGFTEEESQKLISNGFKQLDIIIKQELDFYKYINKLTSRMPQNINDFCNYIAKIYIKEEELVIDFNKDNLNNNLIVAQKQWLQNSFLRYYTQLSELFRNNSVQNNNKNYILFMLGENDRIEFTDSKMHADISEYFETEIGKRVVKNYLNTLSDASQNKNILNSKGGGYYSIRDYKTILCIRLMLYLDENQVCMHDTNDI